MFVDKDMSGNIVAAFQQRQRPGQEELPDAEALAGLEAYRAIKRSLKPLHVRLTPAELLLVRLSSQFPGLSAQRRQRVQDAIDTLASEIIGGI